jgi:methylated-DNA-[protein]-cysteine S-methyltransferase
MTERDPLHVVSLDTPLGEFTVACSARGVVATAFTEQGEDRALVAARLEERYGRPVHRGGPDLVRVRTEVDAYFGGRLRAFSTPVDLGQIAEGFGRRVLEVTATIPFGELWTYGDVAGLAGSPRGGRAAGNALSHCPIELFVPCHRVVHAGGGIGGYGRHEERKRWLIAHEGRL